MKDQVHYMAIHLVDLWKSSMIRLKMTQWTNFVLVQKRGVVH
jgi:hypothetical protein